jgi:hypothetical protein
MKKDSNGIYQEDPVDAWFGLSYAQYLTVPRSILQEMSLEWQDKFVALLEELDNYNWRPKRGRYRVELREEVYDKDGDFKKWGPSMDDPLMEYRHGNETAREIISEGKV